MYTERELIVKLSIITWINNENSEEDCDSYKVIKSKFFVHEDFSFDASNQPKVSSSQNETKEDRTLLKIKKVEGKYFLYDGSLSNQGFSKENVDSLNDRLWYVLPKESGENPKIDTLLENDYILQLNDIVKLGKVKFAVIGLNLPNQCDLTIDSNTTEYMDGDIRHNNFPIFDTNQNNSEIINNSFCVICMSESNYDNNPLLTLCKCKGGMRYTHFICLRKWMETKITKKVNDKNNVFSYHVKSFMCNICKTPYPFRIQIKDKVFSLIEVNKPSSFNYYLILESLDSFKDDKHMKAIHVIILSDSAIKVGRSNKVDMVIDHDSVSRQHATINFVRGRVVIRDLKSKYGSYALMKCPVLIKKYSLCFKTKRTLINIGLCKIEDYEKSKKDTRDDTTNLKKDIMHGLI